MRHSRAFKLYLSAIYFCLSPVSSPFPFIGFPAVRRKGGKERKTRRREKGAVSKVMEILWTHTEMTIEVLLSPTPISICLHFSPEQYPLRLSNTVVLRYKRPKDVHFDSHTSERANNESKNVKFL